MAARAGTWCGSAPLWTQDKRTTRRRLKRGRSNGEDSHHGRVVGRHGQDGEWQTLRTGRWDGRNNVASKGGHVHSVVGLRKDRALQVLVDGRDRYHRAIGGRIQIVASTTVSGRSHHDAVLIVVQVVKELVR